MDEKTKKILSIVLINVISVVTIYFIFAALIQNSNIMESPAFKKQINDESIDLSGYEVEHFPSDFVRIDYNNKTLHQFCGEERITYNTDYKGNPIIVLGSSYAYGHGLKKEDSFPNVLSDITKRPVYNFAVCGSELPRNIPAIKEFFGRITEEERQRFQSAQDVIYIYMYDHINRYISQCNSEEYKDNFFKLSRTEQFFNKIFLFRYINERIKVKHLLDDSKDKYICDFIENVILDGYRKTKNYFPNSRFTIILYDEKIPLDNHKKYEIKFAQDVINSSAWKKLEKETQGNIRIVHTKDVVGFVFDKNYKLKADIADWHPSEKVWTLFTPLFAKRYLAD